jgi:hypothetical protein
MSARTYTLEAAAKAFHSDAKNSEAGEQPASWDNDGARDL